MIRNTDTLPCCQAQIFYNHLSSGHHIYALSLIANQEQHSYAPKRQQASSVHKLPQIGTQIASCKEHTPPCILAAEWQ